MEEELKAVLTQVRDALASLADRVNRIEAELRAHNIPIP
jgi:hypothetical protein